MILISKMMVIIITGDASGSPSLMFIHEIRVACLDGRMCEMVNYNQMMIIMCVAQYEINLQLWFQKLKHSEHTK